MIEAGGSENQAIAARAMLRDLRQIGNALWQRFTVTDPAEHLWHYELLLQTFRTRGADPAMVDELGRVIEA